MSLRLVPFNETWITHDKIDIHAIYRRKHLVMDEFGELQQKIGEDGLPIWDLTGGLPVKGHNKWASKGLEYVTLANRESLIVAAKTGTLPPGTHYRDFDQHHAGGPWNYKMYLEGQAAENASELERLRADVAAYGADAVEAIRRSVDPNFRLPESLRQAQAVAVAVPEAPHADVTIQAQPKKRMGRPKGSKNKPRLEVPA